MEDDKVFKLFELKAIYQVIKCPYCENCFRWEYNKKVCNKLIKKPLCVHCGKSVDIENNCLLEDNILKSIKKGLLIKPNKEQIFFNETKIKDDYVGFEE